MRTAGSLQCATARLKRAALPSCSRSPSSGKRVDRLPADFSDPTKASDIPESGWDLQLLPQQVIFKDAVPLACAKAPLTILNKGKRPQRITVWSDGSTGARFGIGGKIDSERVTCPLLPPGLSLRLHVEAPPFVGPPVSVSLDVMGGGRHVKVPVQALPPLMGLSCPSHLLFPPSIPGQEQQLRLPITNLTQSRIRVHVEIRPPISSLHQKLLQQRLLHIEFCPQALTLAAANVGFFTVVLRLECPAEVSLPITVVTRRLPKPPSSPRVSLNVPEVRRQKRPPARRAKDPQPEEANAVQWTAEGPVVEAKVQLQALCTVPRWVLTAKDCEVKVLDFGTAYYGEERRVRLQAKNLSAIPLVLSLATSQPTLSHTPEAATEDATALQMQQEQHLRDIRSPACSFMDELSLPDTKPCNKGPVTNQLASSRSQENCSFDSLKGDCEYDCEEVLSTRRSSDKLTVSQRSFEACLIPRSQANGDVCFSVLETNGYRPLCTATVQHQLPERDCGGPLVMADLSSEESKVFSGRRDSELSGGATDETFCGCPRSPTSESRARTWKGTLVTGDEKTTDSSEGIVSAQKEQVGCEKPERQARMSRSTVLTAEQTRQSTRSSGHSQATSRSGTPRPAKPHLKVSGEAFEMKQGSAKETEGSTDGTTRQKKRWKSVQRAGTKARQQMVSAGPPKAAVARGPIMLSRVSALAGEGTRVNLTRHSISQKSIEQAPCPSPAFALHEPEDASTAPALALLDSNSSDDLCKVEVAPNLLSLGPHETSSIILRLCTQPCELRKGFRHAQNLESLHFPLSFRLHVLASAQPPVPTMDKQESKGQYTNSKESMRNQKEKQPNTLDGQKAASQRGGFTAATNDIASTGPSYQLPHSDRGSVTAREPRRPSHGGPIVARMRPATAKGTRGSVSTCKDGGLVDFRSKCSSSEKKNASYSGAQQRMQHLPPDWLRVRESLRTVAASPSSQSPYVPKAYCERPQEKQSPGAAPVTTLPPLVLSRRRQSWSCNNEGGNENEVFRRRLSEAPCQNAPQAPCQNAPQQHQVVSGHCMLYLPFLHISPNDLHFGECRVGTVIEKALHISNPNNCLPLDFWVDAPHPFRCEPASGQLQPQQNITVRVFFAPQRMGPVRQRLKVSFCRRLYTQTFRATGTAFALSEQRSQKAHHHSEGNVTHVSAARVDLPRNQRCSSTAPGTPSAKAS